MSRPSTPPLSPGRRPRRVVVADDTADIRLMLTIALGRRADVDLVGEATNGSEAVELVAALRPDLLVLDIAMPVLDGLSALPRIAAISPETRVVMLSALPAAEYRARAMAAGAVAFVEKTTAISTLVEELVKAADLLGVVLDSLVPSVRQGSARDLQEPSAARRFAAETLASWDEADLSDVVELLVSELVTNVVVHTSAAPRVTVRLGRDRVHVEVFDSDPRLPAPRVADSHATSGRGMALVEALSADWGSIQTGDGKIVWFDVARPAPAVAGGA